MAGTTRDFRRLWAARTVSRFGSLLGALPFMAVFFLDASPRDMALLAVASMLPGFLSGLLAGVWVDRLRRRPLMIGADLLRAGFLASVFAAAVTDRMTFPHLYAVAFTNGVLDVLFDVAAIAYLPSVVPRERLLDANSRLVAADAVVEATSFSAGGWIVQLASAPIAVITDAATFVASAVGLVGIRAPEPPPSPRAERAGLVAETREGMALVMRDATLRPIAASLVCRDLSHGAIGAAVLLFVARDLGFQPGAMGLIFAVGGVSSFAGAVMTGRVTAAVGMKRAMVGGLAISAFTAGLLALTGGGMVIATVMLVAQQLFGDGAHTVFEINQETARQSAVPERMLGRVDAAIRVAGLGATTAAALLAGVLGEAFGLRVPIAVGAAARAAGVVALLRLRSSAPPGGSVQ